MASLAIALAALVLAGLGVQGAPTLLVYSRTVGYRHDSIPTAIEAIRNIGSSSGLFVPTFSEDPAQFTKAGLAGFNAIAFLSNSNVVNSAGAVTADVLDSAGVEALREWLTIAGHGLVGLHAATACLFEDESFGVGMGSWFDYHPTIQNATFLKLVSHPTIAMLPDRYTTYEEVYNFRSDPRSVNATVLLTVDATSYTDAEIGTRPFFQGTPHPIAWFRDTPVDLGNGTRNGTMVGRLWMTSLGHTNATWQSDLHLAHVQAGLKWVLEGASNSTSAVTSSSMFSSAGTATAASPTAVNSKAPSPIKLNSSLGLLTAVLLGGLGAVLMLIVG